MRPFLSSASPINHAALHPVPRTRQGRVLVECCVSLLLIAAGSALALLMAAGTARLVDDARQRDLVHHAIARQAATLIADPCTAGAGALRADVGPRAQVLVETSMAGPLRTMTLHGEWQGSAAAGAIARRHEVVATGWCE